MGDLTVEFDIKSNKVVGFIDADGPVFGGGDPPAIPFNATLKKNGSGNFNVPGTPMGDIAGSFDAKGNLTVTITNIPGGVLTEARIRGLFDLKLEKFDMVYEIDNSSGSYAKGVGEAHVPKKPALKVAGKVNYSGKSGKTTARVLTNTGIKSFKAEASGAQVGVIGANPYKIIVKKAKRKITRVKVTAINEDGFKVRKFVKFIKK